MLSLENVINQLPFVGLASAHPVVFALQVRPKAGCHLEEFDNELGRCVVAEDK